MQNSNFILQHLICMVLALLLIAPSSATSNEPVSEELTERERKQLERISDRKRIQDLQKLYAETANAGHVAVDHAYLIDSPMTLNQILDLSHPYFIAMYNSLTTLDKETISESVKEAGFRSARYQAIMNTALKFGMQAGDHYTSTKNYIRLQTSLKGLSEALPFHMLMLADGKIKPPLIEIIGHSSMLEDQRTRREIKRRFQIIQQAEVIHTPPTYMDFFFSLKTERPKSPSAMLLPVNEEEMSYWQRGIRSGWAEGVKQAEMNTRNYARNMVRHLYGYLNYKTLHERGVITAPSFQNLIVGTNSRGDVVNIGESIFEITELPQLNDNDQDWLALPQVDDIFDKLTDEDVRELTEFLFHPAG